MFTKTELSSLLQCKRRFWLERHSPHVADSELTAFD